MRIFRYGAWVVGIAGLLWLLPVIAGQTTTTYGGAAPQWLWLEAVAVIALLVLATLHSDAPRQQLAYGLAGATWLVAEVAGWLAAPDTVTTTADAWSRMLPALVLCGVLSTAARWHRPLIAVAVFGGTLAAASRILLEDPFQDVSCWRRCDHNTLLVADTAHGATLGDVGLLLVAACAALAGVLALLDARRAQWLLAAPIVVLTLGTIGPGVLRMVAAESATSAPFLLLFVAAQAGVIALALALAYARLLQWRLRARLVRLSGNLSGNDASSVTEALRRAVRDPQLCVHYWAPERSMYVDAEGRPVDEPRSDTRHRVTLVKRHGQPVAAVVHARNVDGVRLDAALGAALRLVLENDQLRAATLAELRELQDSRARIVERAALERRRLERNLHDGAQQRVVTLSLLVRMAADRVAGNSTATALADRAAVLTDATVQELRRVAHGIHPTVVVDAGLAGALLDLADASTDVAMQVDGVPPAGYSRTAETTAYEIVTLALTDARGRDARALTVCGHQQDGMLLLDIVDDAPPGVGHPALEFADQVEALGGSLGAEAWRQGTRVRLELPCGS